MIATKKATAQIPDPTDSQATAAAPATTEPAPAAVIPEATPTFSSSITLEQQQLLASLPSRGPAPELVNETWLNTEPLRLADLRGKVVLLDMWTFG
jgi:hypothetical protein